MDSQRDKPTLSAIKSTYTDAKRASDRKNPYVYYVMRPLSWVPTWICLRLGMTANGATWIGFLIGLAGCIAIASGSRAGFLAGALLYNLFFVFDHIDGNIARYHRATNHFGKFIDGVFGALLVMFLLLSVGIGVHRSGGDPSPPFGALLAFLAASAAITRYYISMRLEWAIHQAEAVRPGEPSHPAPAAPGAPRSASGRLTDFLVWLEQATLEGSLLLFAAAGRFEWWIWLYGPLFLVNGALEFLRSMSSGGRRLNVYRPT